MTAPYSIDLRERALARKAAGKTNREIAAALSISPSCVSKWTKRKQETGSLAPVRWVRLSEHIFRVDKWSLCRG